MAYFGCWFCEFIPISLNTDHISRIGAVSLFNFSLLALQFVFLLLKNIIGDVVPYKKCGRKNYG